MDTLRPKTVLYGYLLVSISSKISAFTSPVKNVAGLRGQARVRVSCSSVSSSSGRTTRRLSAAHKSNRSDYNSSSRTGSNKNVDSITDSADRLGVGISAKDLSNLDGKLADGEPLAFLRTVEPAMALENVSPRRRGSPNGEELSMSPGAGLATVNRTERGQRLRALNWVKQVRNDLTSAEFALNLNAFQVDRSATAAATGVGDVGGGKGGGGGDGEGARSKIDYDSIAERLEASLRTLQAGRPLSLLEAILEGELRDLTERLETNLVKIRNITLAERGGRQGVSSEPSPSLKSGNDGNPGDGEEDEGSRPGNPGGILDEMKGGINVKAPEFDLFVRDDGTVDWDGAIQSGREVARFGQELWDRINGQNPHEEGGLVGGTGGSQGVDKPPREIPEDSPVMVSLSAVGAELEGRREQLEKELDALRADARAQEVTWNGTDRRLAQKRIRGKGSEVNIAKRQLQLHRIDVDMERICYNIEQEIRESTSSSSSEYRLLVAEFGLLDAQLSNLNKLSAEIKAGDQAADAIGVNGSDELEGLVIDEDELELVSREVLDLKNRLGMDLENPALTVDPEKITRYVRETYDRIKNGLDFYWTGTKILGNDIGYALTLVSKAAQGSILKPREVRTLRRTAKDCMTFIPFVTILLIPLSPVGHVLVFSFIQRFFPDFFPSTYTDRRQNLLKMYTEVDKKVDWGDSGPSGSGDDGSDDMLENLRNFMSTLNQAGNKENNDRSR